MELLIPERWFERGHDVLGGQRNWDDLWLTGYSPRTMVWAPPPGRARHNLEELEQARQERKKSLHIFVCPSLLFTEWRNPLYHSADIIIQIKFGRFYFWPSDMHETRIVAILFPYLSRQGPTQDAPYNLILWYLSKIIYLL